MSRKVEGSLREISGVNRVFDGLCGRSAGKKLQRKALRGTKLEAACKRNANKISPVDAVLKMVDDRGYVVLMFTGPIEFLAGDVTQDRFAGGYLRGLILRVAEKSTRREWNSQVKALGLEDPNGVNRGQKFYRAVLQEPK